MKPRCIAPLVDFCLEGGLVVSRGNTAQDKNPVLPTFDSTWAGLPYVESRVDRALCTNVRDGPEPMRLHIARMRSRHNWNSVPIQDLGFRKYVLQDTVHQKGDVKRFRQLAMQDNASAMEGWSQFAANSNYWEVPSTLMCGRTFARDVLDCYYLDEMDYVLQSRHTLPRHKFPLFTDALMGRWWNAFKHRANFAYERYMRNRYGLLIPFDCYETMYFDDASYKEVFPQCPQWLQALKFPEGVPLPLPPVIYYYHEEMVVREGGAMSERCRRLWQIFRMEICTMFCAFWFNEATRGGRLFLVEKGTITVLKDVCKDVKWVKGSQILFPLMEFVHKLPRHLECYMVSTNPHMSNSVYFHAFHGTGEADVRRPGGEVGYLSFKSRRIRLAARQQRRMEERRSSPMTLSLHPQDLSLVEGLPALIVAKQWDLNGSLTVRGPVSLLYDTASKTTRTVDQISQEVGRLQQENESLRNFINGTATGHPPAVRATHLHHRPSITPFHGPSNVPHGHAPQRADRGNDEYNDDRRGEQSGGRHHYVRDEGDWQDWNEWVGTGRENRDRYQRRGIGYDRRQRIETNDEMRYGYGYHDVSPFRGRVRQREWTAPESGRSRFRRSSMDNDY